MAYLLSWRRIGFRSLAWWIERRSRPLRRWLGGGWGRLTLVLGGVAALMWLRDWLAGEARPLPDLLTLPVALEVAAVAGLLLLLYWTVEARRRVAIEAFVDETGEPALERTIASQSAFLVDQIAHLHNDFRFADEASPPATFGENQPVEVTLGVEGLGALAADLVREESVIRVGKGLLEVPIAALARLGQWALKGPRLSVGVHRTDGRLTLIARLCGGGRSDGWRVDEADLAPIDALTPGGSDGAAAEGALRALTEQLAYRVFTSLAHPGSLNWRAVRCFTSGLRAYRQSKAGQLDRLLRLLDAEQQFQAALEQDPSFAHCHYNLGIVYRDLGRTDSADQVFRRAAEGSAGLYDAWYGRAVLCYRDPQRYRETVQLCGIATALAPAEARAWDLKGLAFGKLEQQAASIEARERATALAWRALCRVSDTDASDIGAKRIAKTCTLNLAVAHAKAGHYARAIRLLNQAIRLDPTALDLRFELGKVCFQARRWGQTVAALESASPDALVAAANQAIYWACLSEAYTRRAAGDDLIELARMRFAEAAVFAEDLDALRGQVANRKSVADTWQRVQAIRDKLDTAVKSPPAEAFNRLRRLAASTSEPWGLARVQIALVDNLLKADTLTEAESSEAKASLDGAIGLLQEINPRRIVEQGLYGRLAKVGLQRGELAAALMNAQRAVASNPQGAWERGVLGAVYQALGDPKGAITEWLTGLTFEPSDTAPQGAWERGVLGAVYQALGDPKGAITEWLTGLTFEPSDTAILQQVANAQLRQGWSVGTPEARGKAAAAARNALETLVRLPDEAEPAGDAARLALNSRASFRFQFGYANRALLDDHAAIEQFRIAGALGYKPLESAVERAWTCVDARVYLAAEAAYGEVVKGCICELRKQPPRRREDALRQPAALSGEERPIAELLAQAWLQSAFALVERGVKLPQAERRLRYAERLLYAIAPTRQPLFKALLHEARGWLAMQREQPAAAIAALEKATAAGTEEDAGTYYRLARAYVAQASCETDPARCLDKASAACQRADAADWDGRYRARIAALVTALGVSPKDPVLAAGQIRERMAVSPA